MIAVKAQQLNIVHPVAIKDKATIKQDTARIAKFVKINPEQLREDVLRSILQRAIINREEK
jgi:hypothetical protein